MIFIWRKEKPRRGPGLFLGALDQFAGDQRLGGLFFKVSEEPGLLAHQSPVASEVISNVEPRFLQLFQWGRIWKSLPSGRRWRVRAILQSTFFDLQFSDGGIKMRLIDDGHIFSIQYHWLSDGCHVGDCGCCRGNDRQNNQGGSCHFLFSRSNIGQE
jgi:hypothetical protein